MDVQIRPAQADDVPAMVALSEAKRTQYEAYQPLFWRKAPDSAEKQSPFVAATIQRENVIALVQERAGEVIGFVIGTLVNSPPVYSAGLTCLIDDYCVTDQDWEGTGQALLDAVGAIAKERGASQILVVCGHLDQPKRALLAAAGHTIASEWWVRPL